MTWGLSGSCNERGSVQVVHSSKGWILKTGFVVGLAVVVLSGCASMGMEGKFTDLKPGVPGSEVTARLGKPVRTTDAPDGGKTLEFSDTPIGSICYKVQLDAAGNVVATRDMFTDEHLASIKHPMTVAELEKAMCVGASRSGPNGRGEMAWDWVIRQPGIRDGERFIAYVKSGHVVRSERIMIIKDDGGS